MIFILIFHPAFLLHSGKHTFSNSYFLNKWLVLLLSPFDRRPTSRILVFCLITGYHLLLCVTWSWGCMLSCQDITYIFSDIQKTRFIVLKSEASFRPVLRCGLLVCYGFRLSKPFVHFGIVSFSQAAMFCWRSSIQISKPVSRNLALYLIVSNGFFYFRFSA
jgi:hypothetical protein